MSKCLQCGNDNPPSKGNKKRKYCSKKCANKYLQKTKRYGLKPEGWIRVTHVRQKESKRRREEYERYDLDPNFYQLIDMAKEIGISKCNVSLRAKDLEIEPVVKISYEGGRQFYNKKQLDQIKDYPRIIMEMKLRGEQLPETYAQRMAKVSAKQKEKRRTAREEAKKDPKLRKAYSKKMSDQWKYRKERGNKYPYVKLARNVSITAYVACKRQGSGKAGSVWSTLPYNSKDLQRHLESQWEDWMTWDNYGTRWCIDHIIPQSKLIYDNVNHPNFLRCWALSNLRPLCVFENRSKGSYYEGERHTYSKERKKNDA